MVSLGLAMWRSGLTFTVLVILWGVVVTLNAACHSFAPIVALRVLLGVLEASAAPR